MKPALFPGPPLHPHHSDYSGGKQKRSETQAGEGQHEAREERDQGRRPGCGREDWCRGLHGVLGTQEGRDHRGVPNSCEGGVQIFRTEEETKSAELSNLLNTLAATRIAILIHTVFSPLFPLGTMAIGRHE